MKYTSSVVVFALTISACGGSVDGGDARLDNQRVTGSADVPDVSEDADEIVSGPASVPDHRAERSCVRLPTKVLPVGTSCYSILGGPRGFMLLGYPSPVNGTATDPQAELQYWDLERLEVDHMMYVGDRTELLRDGGSDEGYLALTAFPLATGGYSDRQATAFGPDGQVTVTGPLGGNSLPGVSNIVAIKGGSRRMLWSKYEGADDPCSIWSTPVVNGQFGNSMRELVWPDLSYTGGLMAASSNGITAIIAGVSCREVPSTSGCVPANDLVLWDETVPAEGRQPTRVVIGDLISDIFPSPDGFELVQYGGQAIFRYSLKGEYRETISLPPDTRKITPFNNGYAVITTDSSSLRKFQFLTLASDGSVLETIPFEGDTDRYQLAVGNLALVGKDTFAFAWSSLAVNDGRGRLEIFECK